MRMMFLALSGIAAIVLATSADAATLTVRLSRPNTAAEQLRYDQALCNRSAVTMRFRHGGMRTGGSNERAVWLDRNPRVFLRCMVGKGYQLDPDGYPIRLMRV